MNRQQKKITALYCRIDSGKQNELDAQYGQIQSLLDYAASTDFPTLISSVTGVIVARQPTDRHTAVCFRRSQAVM